MEKGLLIPEWLVQFEFDSEDQKKAMLALDFWKNDKMVKDNLRPTDLYLLEQIKIAHDHTISAMAGQISILQRDIRSVMDENSRLKKEGQNLTQTIGIIGLSINQIKSRLFNPAPRAPSPSKGTGPVFSSLYEEKGFKSRLFSFFKK